MITGGLSTFVDQRDGRVPRHSRDGLYLSIYMRGDRPTRAGTERDAEEMSHQSWTPICCLVVRREQQMASAVGASALSRDSESKLPL